MPFDPRRADKVCEFIGGNRKWPGLVHTKGVWSNVKFTLTPWQRDDILRPLFGTTREDGRRQYRTAYLEMPRRQGKSEIAAAVALYLLLADDEQGGEVYGAASDRDQASIIFEIARRMVELHPILSTVVEAYKTKVLYYPKTGSTYKVLSSDAFTKHGLNASGIVFDELHAQPNRELWDVLSTSTGSRAQPLIFATTTAGYDRNSICWEVRDYAEKVANGVVVDPSFFSFIRSAPQDADWRDERVWRACNPAIDSGYRSIEEMRDLATRADASPALQNTFRRLYLSQWTQQSTRWMDIKVWDASAGLIRADTLLGRPCYGGLDLASRTDLAALALVFPPDEPGGEYAVLPHFWVPEDNIVERSRRDRVPYAAWAEQGLLTATPGNVIDYGTIRATILALATHYDLREVAYDRWGATQLVQDLGAEGITCVPFGQGYASMSEPTKELQSLVLQKRLRHGGHPVLRWNMDNVVASQDPAGNIKLDKAKSTERIDGSIAMIMGLARATLHRPARRSVYETRGVEIA